jgi:antitoxin component YwqK of YwqJK toxin-antitoxin module
MNKILFVLAFSLFSLAAFAEGWSCDGKKAAEINGIITYENGLIVTAVCEKINETGDRSKIANVVNGLFDGYVRTYTGEKITSEVSYKIGKREGEVILYHSDTGKIKTVAHYSNDVIVDTIKHYDENGILINEVKP